MIEVETGGAVLLELTLKDGTTGAAPSAYVHDDTGTQIAGSPFAMTHRLNGLYQVTFSAPAAGDYSVAYVTATFETVDEHVRVHSSWDELQASHVVAGSFGEDADVAVSTRATQSQILSDATPFQGADVALILTDTAAMEPLISANVDAAISTRSTQADILSDATPFAGANVDAAISTRATQSDILSDATPFPGANVDATISSRSSHSAADVDTVLTASHGAGTWQQGMTTSQGIRDAMKLAPTAGAPAVGSVDEHLDNIEADTSVIEPLVSANVDATISSRSSHSAADVDTAITASHGAGSYATATGFAVPGDQMELTSATKDSVVDRTWDESIAAHTGAGTFGDSLQATVASRATPAQTAASVWSEPVPGATAPGEAGFVLAAAGTDITANLDVAVSTRSSHSPADVDVQLSGAHGAGSWEKNTASELADGVWDESQAAHVIAGSTGESLNNAGAGATPGVIADAVWDETRAAHVGAGSFGEALQSTVDSRAVPGDAMALTPAERTATADEIWDEALPGAHVAGTAGERLASTDDRVDATVSSRATQAQILSDATPFAGARIDANISTRSSHNPVDVDTQLSGTHGAGDWQGQSSFTAPQAAQILVDTASAAVDSAAIDARLPADPSDESNQDANHAATQASIAALNDIDDADVQAAMTAQGYTAARAPNLDNLDAAVSTRAVAGDAMALTAAAVDDIWDEALSSHIGAGSAGQALLSAFGNAGGNVRDDALTYDANSRPLTLRRRIFADAATANASTPGGIAEGELLAFTITASHVDAAEWQTLLRTI